MDILNAGDDEAANRIAVAISFGVSGGDPENYSGTPAWSSLAFFFNQVTHTISYRDCR
jgi:hypothetical protein